MWEKVVMLFYLSCTVWIVALLATAAKADPGDRVIWVGAAIIMSITMVAGLIDQHLRSIIELLNKDSKS